MVLKLIVWNIGDGECNNIYSGFFENIEEARETIIQDLYQQEIEQRKCWESQRKLLDNDFEIDYLLQSSIDYYTRNIIRDEEPLIFEVIKGIISL